jgi:lysozyme family protein
MTIDTMIAQTIALEGGYSNNPADPGGATNFGITQAVAKANGYTGDMRRLTRDQATAIYRSQYAIKPGFAAVEAINPHIGAELFDTGVNMGPVWPALWFQQCLNTFNASGTLYPDIPEDADKPGGGIGPTTLGALRSYLQKRGANAETVMLRALNGLQAARYIDLARQRVANEAFVFGWFAGRIS